MATPRFVHGDSKMSFGTLLSELGEEYMQEETKKEEIEEDKSKAYARKLKENIMKVKEKDKNMI